MADIEYDYALVPTIGRFSQLRKFIRGLMGPFGSGKSSGCVMDIVQWAARQPEVTKDSRLGKRKDERFSVAQKELLVPPGVPSEN